MSRKRTAASKALDILRDVGIHLRDNPEKAELVQDVVDILETGMGYEFLAVLIVTEPGKEMHPLALSKQGQDEAFLEADKAYVKSRCATQSLGLTRWVATTAQSARVGKVIDDPRYFGIRDDIKSELCVPLLVGKEVIGVINTETTRPDAYTATDERFLETAACHLALGIKYNQQRSGDRGGVTMCSYCRRVRVEPDTWISTEAYVMIRSGIRFSHGICPPCYERAVDSHLRD